MGSSKSTVTIHRSIILKGGIPSYGHFEYKYEVTAQDSMLDSESYRDFPGEPDVWHRLDSDLVFTLNYINDGYDGNGILFVDLDLFVRDALHPENITDSYIELK